MDLNITVLKFGEEQIHLLFLLDEKRLPAPFLYDFFDHAIAVLFSFSLRKPYLGTLCSAKAGLELTIIDLNERK